MNLHDLVYGDGFLEMTSNTQMSKREKDILDFTKIKNLYASKDTINKMSRQPTDWNKLFVRHLLGKYPIYELFHLK